MQTVPFAQVVFFVLFLLLLLAVYITFSREQKEYEQIEEVMEDEEQKDFETEEKKALWQGMINDYPVVIQRGVDFRDSNRLITINVKSEWPVEVRVDRYNILRRFVRAFYEVLGNRVRVKLEGPLENFLIYSESPQKTRDILGKLNSPEYSEVLQEFHHLDFLDDEVKGWFYQLDVDIEKIKDRARKLTELMGELDIQPVEVETN